MNVATMHVTVYCKSVHEAKLIVALAEPALGWKSTFSSNNPVLGEGPGEFPLGLMLYGEPPDDTRQLAEKLAGEIWKTTKGFRPIRVLITSSKIEMLAVNSPIEIAIQTNELFQFTEEYYKIKLHPCVIMPEAVYGGNKPDPIASCCKARVVYQHPETHRYEIARRMVPEDMRCERCNRLLSKEEDHD